MNEFLCNFLLQINYGKFKQEAPNHFIGAIDEGSKAKRSHLLPAKHEDLEAAVLRWFKAARSENIPISGLLLAVRLVYICKHMFHVQTCLLQEKAQKLAKELAKPMRKALEHKHKPLMNTDAQLEKKAEELEAFKASVGWLDRFKHRHSISFKGNQGEAADIDLEALGNWQVRFV